MLALAILFAAWLSAEIARRLDLSRWRCRTGDNASAARASRGLRREAAWAAAALFSRGRSPRSRRWRASAGPVRGSAVALVAAEVARAAIERGIVAQVSGIVWRWLREDAIRPLLSLLSSRATRSSPRSRPYPLSLEGRWEGLLLEPGDFVLCSWTLDPGPRPHLPTEPTPSGLRVCMSSSARARCATWLPVTSGAPGSPPLRTQGRHLTIRSAHRAVHEHRALRVRAARVRRRRQRLYASRLLSIDRLQGTWRTSSSYTPRSTPPGSTCRDLLHVAQRKCCCPLLLRPRRARAHAAGIRAPSNRSPSPQGVHSRRPPQAPRPSRSAHTAPARPPPPPPATHRRGRRAGRTRALAA